MTSEWLGNYNFGYTGRMFFSLSTLKFGSNLASGFSNDDYLDYPAIEVGYYHSGIIEG